jgi:hypothetical protein
MPSCAENPTPCAFALPTEIIIPEKFGLRFFFKKFLMPLRQSSVRRAIRIDFDPSPAAQLQTRIHVVQQPFGRHDG